MNTYKLINKNTNQVIREVKANTVLEVVKQYDLATRENDHIQIVQA